jgi:hypothetical protein
MCRVWLLLPCSLRYCLVLASFPRSPNMICTTQHRDGTAQARGMSRSFSFENMAGLISCCRFSSQKTECISSQVAVVALLASLSVWKAMSHMLAARETQGASFRPGQKKLRIGYLSVASRRCWTSFDCDHLQVHDRFRSSMAI